MEVPVAASLISAQSVVELLFKIAFVAFGVVYFIFTLVVLRQVNLMASTIRTEAGGLLKAFAILYAGFALGVIVLFIGLF
jgi:hypothetical protein